MIVRPRPRMRELFFIWKGSIIPLILPQVLFVTVVAAVVTSTAEFLGPRFPDFATGPFTFLGLSLSLFLGFRNNACYDRWWEARKHYGNLLVVMRCLARDSALLATDAAAAAEALGAATGMGNVAMACCTGAGKAPRGRLAATVSAAAGAGTSAAEAMGKGTAGAVSDCSCTSGA